jgi:hypothetical protein
MSLQQPKYASRQDANSEILDNAFRGMGDSVLDLHLVGKGCPDRLVGIDGANVLVEYKRPPGPKGGMHDRNLTDSQIEFRAKWRGAPVHVVRTVEDVGVLDRAVRAREPRIATRLDPDAEPSGRHTSED